MIKTVTLGAIGVRSESLEESIRLAASSGFKGLDFDIRQVDALGVELARSLFEQHSISPEVFGIPFEWRADKDKWETGLAELPRLAKTAGQLGCQRCATWIMPASNDLDYQPNFEFHIARLEPIAKILGEYNIRLGLEFVGPKTLRSKFTYPFIYDGEKMLTLGAACGANVGLLLDSYHWYTSHGTVNDLKALSPEQIVYVHINDAVEGMDVDEQLDGDRRLPGSTGVIDLPGFLGALKQIGFTGPVACEPFFSGLKEMASDQERLSAVKQAVDTVFDLADLK